MIAPTPPTEEPRNPSYGELLADHARLLDQQDEWRAEIREMGAAYERVVAERDEAQATIADLRAMHKQVVAEALRSNIALKQTIDAFPDANNAANIAHARAERDRLRSDLNQATAARQRLDLLVATFDGTAMWNGSGLYAGLRDILASWDSSPSEGNTTPCP